MADPIEAMRESATPMDRSVNVIASRRHSLTAMRHPLAILALESTSLSWPGDGVGVGFMVSVPFSITGLAGAKENFRCAS